MTILPRGITYLGTKVRVESVTTDFGYEFTEKFREALNYLDYAGGGTLSIGAGVFYTDTLNIPSNVTVKGAGIGHTTLIFTAGHRAGKRMIMIGDGAENIVIDGITFDGNRSSNEIFLHDHKWSTGFQYWETDTIRHNSTNSYQCTAEHIAAESNEPGVGEDWDKFWKLHGRSVEQQHCLWVDMATNVTIENCFFTNNAGDGVRIGGAKNGIDVSSQIRVRKCRFNKNYRNGLTLGGYGYSDIHITDNWFGPKIDTQQIDCEPLSGTVIATGVRISGNKFETIDDSFHDNPGSEYAITLTPGQSQFPMTDVSVVDNIICGPVLVYRCTGVIIANNQKISSDISGRSSITIKRSSNVKVTNNNIYQMAQASGILIQEVYEERPQNIMVSGNTIYGKEVGVDIKNADFVNVFSNSIHGMNREAISIRAQSADSLNPRCHSNTFHGTTHGIYVYGVNGYVLKAAMFTENVLVSDSGSCIYFNTNIIPVLDEQSVISMNSVIGDGIPLRKNHIQSFLISGQAEDGGSVSMIEGEMKWDN